MKNKKLIRFVESLILLPMTTMSGVPMGPITQGALNIMSTPQTVLSQKLNTTDENLAFNNGEDSEVINLEAKADAIDAYFRSNGMPLAGFGKKMVIEAEKNGLDWRLIAAISVRESTGGKFACKRATHNAFGWGSCKINFKSTDIAIETVARNLGGNNPNTAHHYDNKTTLQILRAYNPPSIVPRYGEQVISIMDTIGDINLGLKTSGPSDA
jgi:hypothetical protein